MTTDDDEHHKMATNIVIIDGNIVALEYAFQMLLTAIGTDELRATLVDGLRRLSAQLNMVNHNDRQVAATRELADRIEKGTIGTFVQNDEDEDEDEDEANE